MHYPDGPLTEDARKPGDPLPPARTRARDFGLVVELPLGPRRMDRCGFAVTETRGHESPTRFPEEAHMTPKAFMIAIATPVLLAGGLMLSAGPALAAPSSSAKLNGSAEVGQPGDATATGSATVTADPASGQVCATVTSDLKGAVAMHIHKGAAGANGPVVVPLDPKKINAGKACVTAKSVAAQLAADPSGFYVNIHTATHPAGAIRGQLAAAASTPASTPAPGAPTGVAAGSGGHAAPGADGDLLLILVVTAGAGLAGAAGWRLARR